MPKLQPVKTLQEFMTLVWQTEPLQNTHIRLYRGQRTEAALLPKLFRSPNNLALAKEDEIQLLDDFKNHSPFLLPSRPNNEWDWLSLGQHFGLPTRLLDWSANPLTALFFAVEEDDSQSPVVYTYHAKKAQVVTDREKKRSPFAITTTRIMQPSWHSIRVAMQAGWHTVHRLYGEEGKPIKALPLQSMQRHDERTTSITIDPNAVTRIRGELGNMGVRHATVYGDLQSVARAIGKEYGHQV